MGRTKMSSGRAAEVASSVVPNPAAPVVPPHEADVVIEEAPWDAAAEEVSLDDDFAKHNAPESIRTAAASPARSKSTATPAGEKRGWGGVIEHAFSIDPQELYQRLYEELRLGDGATEYGVVLAAADRAEQNAVDAVRLARHAKLEDEAVSRKIEERLEVLRSAAKKELDQEVIDSYDEKLKKTTKKAPTIQDIADRVQANWPDEYNSASRRKEEMHGVLRICEGIAESWRSRCATLRGILERVAPVRPR